MTFSAALLEHPITFMVARIVLTTLFWMAGIFGVFNFGVIVQEMVAQKLPLPALFAVATIACQLGGSALLISNFGGYGWVGALGLALFTLLTIPFGHAFWEYAEPQRTEHFHIALEHITVVGGLLLAALLSLKPQ